MSPTNRAVTRRLSAEQRAEQQQQRGNDEEEKEAEEVTQTPGSPEPAPERNERTQRTPADNRRSELSMRALQLTSGKSTDDLIEEAASLINSWAPVTQTDDEFVVQDSIARNKLLADPEPLAFLSVTLEGEVFLLHSMGEIQLKNQADDHNGEFCAFVGDVKRNDNGSFDAKPIILDLADWNGRPTFGAASSRTTIRRATSQTRIWSWLASSANIWSSNTLQVSRRPMWQHGVIIHLL